MKGGHSRMRDFPWLMNSWWTLAKMLVINVWRWKVSSIFRLQQHWTLQGYVYQTKASYMCLFALDRIRGQAGVGGEKCSWYFISTHLWLPFWHKFTNRVKSCTREWPPCMIYSGHTYKQVLGQGTSRLPRTGRLLCSTRLTGRGTLCLLFRGDLIPLEKQ